MVIVYEKYLPPPPIPIPTAVCIKAREHPLWLPLPLTLSVDGLSWCAPCCTYFFQPITGAVVRERCAACKTPERAYSPPIPTTIEDESLITRGSFLDTSFVRYATATAARHAAGDGRGEGTRCFDSVARGGILADSMGLGKTLELTYLIAAHPATPQPFALGGGARTASDAMMLAISGASLDAMRSTLSTLARLPSASARAFDIANELALGSKQRSSVKSAKLWTEFDPLENLGLLENGYLIASRATLVICPAALRAQWANEIQRWTDNRLAVVVFPGRDATSIWDAVRDGSNLDFGAVIAGPERRSTADGGARQLRNLLALATADVVLASHEELDNLQLSSTSGLKTRAKGSVSGLVDTRIDYFTWHRIIVDEIQLVSGATIAAGASAAATAIRRAKALCDLQCDLRWPTSGTPLESPLEIFTILQFLQSAPFANDFYWQGLLAPALRALTPIRASYIQELRKQALKLDGLIDKYISGEARTTYAAAKAKEPAYPAWSGGGVQTPEYVINACTNEVRHAINFLRSEVPSWMPLRTDGKPWVALGISPTTTPENIEAIRVAKSSYTVEAVMDSTATDMSATQMLLAPLGGSGFDLLRSLLKPILWRNTAARVASVLTLPPVTEVVLRLKSAGGEETITNELRQQFRKGIVVQARALVAVAAGASNAPQLKIEAEAAAAAARAAYAAAGGTAHSFASRSCSAAEVIKTLRDAVWDLRCACANMGADERVFARLGLRGLSKRKTATMSETVRAFVATYEERLDTAHCEAASCGLGGYHAALEILFRCTKTKKEGEPKDYYPAGVSKSDVLARMAALLRAGEAVRTIAKAALRADINSDSEPEEDEEMDEDVSSDTEEGGGGGGKKIKKGSAAIFGWAKDKDEKEDNGKKGDLIIFRGDTSRPCVYCDSMSCANFDACRKNAKKEKCAHVVLPGPTMSTTLAEWHREFKRRRVLLSRIRGIKQRLSARAADLATYQKGSLPRGFSHSSHDADDLAAKFGKAPEFGEEKSIHKLWSHSGDLLKAAQTQAENLPSIVKKLAFARTTADAVSKLSAPPPPTAEGGGTGGGGGGGVDAQSDPLECNICGKASNETDPELRLTELNTIILPCAHVFCVGCVESWVREKNGGKGYTITPQSSATCFGCNQPYQIGDCFAVSATVGVTREEQVQLLTDFVSGSMSVAGGGVMGGGGAGAGAGAGGGGGGVTTIGGSDGLPSGLATSATVNAIKLRSTQLGIKLSALVRRIKALPKDEKVIVATSWAGLRKITGDSLKAEGIPNVVIAEKATADEIATRLSTFKNTDALTCRVLVLAVATDCAGLTLTRANHLFILDPIISPAVFAQLVGRIARQGQSRPCTVYNMVVSNSVEENMIKLRTRLAAGQGSGGSAATLKVDAAARSAGGASSKGDANEASLSRLPLGDLLELVTTL